MTAMSAFYASVREVLPHGQGTVIALLANRAKIDAAYENCDSLLWRDAGYLMATLHLCAGFVGLDTCALGLMGKELATAVAPANSAVACGISMVGHGFEPLGT